MVAKEVRNLAGKSAEAAERTTALINESAHAVENGNLLADDTAETLSKVLSQTEEVSRMIAEIAAAAELDSQAAKLRSMTEKFRA